MTALTTHVLDTATGQPAAGMTVRLYRVADSRQLLVSTETNHDGRCDAPLLDGERFVAGTYELEFDAGDYFGLPQPRFLETVIIRFGVDNPQRHYHVPLLIAPFGYSTYRGS